MTEPDDDQDDEELNEGARGRSVFASAWFRAVIVTAALAVIAVVALPYFSDVHDSPRSQTRGDKQALAAKPAPPAAIVQSIQVASAGSSASPAPAAPAAPARTVTAATQPPSPDPISPATQQLVARAKESAMKESAAKESPPKESAAKESLAKDPATRDSATKVLVAQSDGAAKKSESAAKKSAPDASARKADVAKSDASPKMTVAAAKSTASSRADGFWVQIGAFKDADTARRIAAKLRSQHFQVTESRSPGSAAPAAAPAPAKSSGGDRYEVVVSGAPQAQLGAKISEKGLAARTVGDSAIIEPALPLGEAVALSKDLAATGLKVQVRRVGGPAAPAAPSVASGEGLHRVRVGPFDRAGAIAAAKTLKAKGYSPYIARGNE